MRVSSREGGAGCVVDRLASPMRKNASFRESPGTRRFGLFKKWLVYVLCSVCLGVRWGGWGLVVRRVDRPHRLVVRTSPFQGENAGSIPAGVVRLSTCEADDGCGGLVCGVWWSCFS